LLLRQQRKAKYVQAWGRHEWEDHDASITCKGQGSPPQKFLRSLLDLRAHHPCSSDPHHHHRTPGPRLEIPGTMQTQFTHHTGLFRLKHSETG
jgi:hypothetical protein